MSSTTKRKPGRPAAKKPTPAPKVEEIVVEEPVAVKPAPVAGPKKYNGIVVKERRFQLRGNMYPPSFMMKTGSKGDLLDPKADFPRPIRHCPNERSIYLDEQSEFAVIEPIIFEKGYLTVPASKMYTQHFLFSSPEYGVKFEYVDPAEAAERRMEIDDLQTELKYHLKQAASNPDARIKLAPVAAAIVNSSAVADQMTVPELRDVIRAEVDANPRRFTNEKGEPELFSPAAERRYLALRSVAQNLISLSTDGSKYYWTESGTSILNIPAGVKPIEHLVEYLGTDDGVILAREFAKQL